MIYPYENFTVKPVVNGFIPEADMERFLKGGGDKEDYKKLRTNGDIGSTISGSHIDTREMDSLKEKTPEFLKPSNPGESTSRYVHDQSKSDFWKAIGGSS